ncbi:MAG: ankyrin repeat domain-containing protein [Candidatus Solibacter sp.]
MSNTSELLAALGGESGCRRLSAAFYARVAKDPVLRPLFPGKSQKCAIEEMAAFLIQFLEGDEGQTQHRWWLSLRESHARFRIEAAQRAAWLQHMRATLDGAVDGETGAAFMQFFERSSTYVMGGEARAPEQAELAERWAHQRVLDAAIAAIAGGRDEEALALAPRFAGRRSVLVGLLARMLQTGRPRLIAFAMEKVGEDASLATAKCGGRGLLHYAAGAGCLPVVELLLRLGTDPDLLRIGKHTALYSVANECGSEAGPRIVRALVGAGADVNACAGVTRSTPLHMAARRGHVETARTLLELGARRDARDSKGATPLQRAVNCRKAAVAQLLR